VLPGHWRSSTDRIWGRTRRVGSAKLPTVTALPETQLAAEPARISYVVGRLDRALSIAVDNCVAAQGLTVPQYTALSILSRRSGLSNAQLARRTFVRPQSMTKVINALVERGLIKRTPDANHGRILRTEITPQGHELLAACDAAVDEMERTMLTGLTRSQQGRLLDSLSSCVEHLGDYFEAS
jgi:DNA-binding MarR family transcriptional regulator